MEEHSQRDKGEYSHREKNTEEDGPSIVLCNGSSEEVEDERSRIAAHVDEGDQEATVLAAEGDREYAHRNVVRGRDREAEDKDRDHGGREP